MNYISTIKLAAILGALTVAIGAFGAHGLADILEQYGRTDTFETAVKYQFYHVLAIFLVGLLQAKLPNAKILDTAVYAFLTGIIIFSGSLYVLSTTGVTWLGAITPLGGLAFIGGWIMVFLGAKPSAQK
ncbi:DUF423 domain-containing protein [Echinicola vietnamensis]|uniref:Uncharacterized small membrane protein n=1 Tax=Echinicola vietnamensis (strain DSM 17526 / LMG 23754 / KMM 6221) TaxID=926556 RepID=L0FYV9_ECHVK|nr:DUF423 domain-containing protein [Echinicola vietnamensis]AGA78482.1 uncharacterized small membrane protein [Echinicola vietnamensis DSM 17526]